MKTELTLTITGDGSSTVFNSHLNQHYHSIHGAINESEHVFIRNGLDEVLKTENVINILEIGMGTGLNVLLSVLKSKLLKVKMNFVTVEAYPLQEDILDKINYPEIIGSSEASGYFSKIHKAGWAYPSFLCDYFILSKIQSKLEDVTFSENQFNLIYFDAFDPHAQPEMWVTHVFEKMYSCLKPGGILVTYCTNSEVRRTMMACGFELEKLKGPKGKREVLRARKRS